MKKIMIQPSIILQERSRIWTDQRYSTHQNHYSQIRKYIRLRICPVTCPASTSITMNQTWIALTLSPLSHESSRRQAATKRAWTERLTLRRLGHSISHSRESYHRRISLLSRRRRCRVAGSSWEARRLLFQMRQKLQKWTPGECMTLTCQS